MSYDYCKKMIEKTLKQIDALMFKLDYYIKKYPKAKEKYYKLRGLAVEEIQRKRRQLEFIK